MLVWHLSAGVSMAVPLTQIERQRLIAHLEMTAGWLFDEVSGLSSAQLTFRRAPDAWTILEVIDHLVVVGPIYWQDLQTALMAPGGQKTPASDEDILWYGIDRTNREKAIPTEVPKGLSDLRSGLDAHRKLHARLLQYIRTTEDDLRGHIVERQRCSFQHTNNGISFRFERSRPIPNSRRNSCRPHDERGLRRIVHACVEYYERVAKLPLAAANGAAPWHPNAAERVGDPAAGRGGVTRDQGLSPSTGCSRTGPAEE
jgi:hypothetical protein